MCRFVSKSTLCIFRLLCMLGAYARRNRNSHWVNGDGFVFMTTLHVELCLCIYVYVCV